jgi:hypothetical protein
VEYRQAESIQISYLSQRNSAKYSTNRDRKIHLNQLFILILARTENPRVGGSIPPLATSDLLFCQYLQSGCAAEVRWLCRICAVTFRVAGIGQQMLCGEEA